MSGLEATLMITGGLVLPVSGGELLVRGATALAAAARVPPLVIGLTVVAFGTSAPELAVGVQAALAGQRDLVVGNVVGSNICNVLLILGLSAVITPLVVSRRLIRFDVPLMISASMLLFVLASDGGLGRIDAVVLFVGLVAYLVWTALGARSQSAVHDDEAERGKSNTSTKSFWAILGGFFSLP